ncbi:MAG TPA: ribonuclease HII [Bdellovibrionota bacterium]|nr:ribonuclease HII [Bdellovibrionota bacterium]
MSPNRTNDLFGADEAPFAFEQQLKRDGFVQVAGVDEVGRGALAGPVVAAAVILPLNAKHLEGRVRDSKKMSPEAREEMVPLIQEAAIAFAVGIVEADEIDRINILRASLEAMRKAIDQLDPRPTLCLIDGNVPVPTSIPQKLIVRGDDRVISIGAASILAKVTRDRIMAEWHRRFPSYGFDEHKGYGTVTHLRALETFGLSAIHRRTFISKGNPLHASGS